MSSRQLRTNLSLYQTVKSYELTVAILQTVAFSIQANDYINIQDNSTVSEWRHENSRRRAEDVPDHASFMYSKLQET